jgi:hypothetical protein
MFVTLNAQVSLLTEGLGQSQKAFWQDVLKQGPANNPAMTAQLQNQFFTASFSSQLRKCGKKLGQPF